jgi:hypothetical protein
MKIEKYSFGSIKISGKDYDTDLIISWDGEISKRIRTHLFTKSEFYEILQKEPEIVIVGTGFSGLVEIDPEIEKVAQDENVKLIVKPTKEAVDDFNTLSKKKKVIAMMHLTC